MAVKVRIPTTLRTLTGGASEVQVEGATVGDVIANLEAAHPGFRDRLLDKLATPVPDGETVSIIPAVAGGCGR